MATAIQRRRGTSTQHGSFTGLSGEITIDTTNNTVVVHDGSTAGGHRLAKYSEITSLGDGDITGIVAGAGLTGGATDGDATLNAVGGYGITVNADDIELTNADVRALFSASEMQQMENHLEEALDEGFLGLSTMCLKWDKVDGDREWSKSLPSTYANWKEVSRLNKLVRKYNRVHQGAPNAATPLQVLQYIITLLMLVEQL